MNDKVVNQHVLVLIGKQGIYKTTWLERLLPPELRGYGCKLCNLHDMDKDDRLRTAAEISAKLTWQGNIRHPMDLRSLGKLLSAEGFEQRRLGHNGRRGYLVVENQRNMVADEAIMSELRSENADIADMSF